MEHLMDSCLLQFNFGQETRKPDPSFPFIRVPRFKA